MERIVNVHRDRINIVKSILQRIRRLGVTVTIEENSFTLSGEALQVIQAESIIKSIGRGFPPQDAFDLLEDENTVAIITLPKNESVMKRLKSRIIGKEGRARKNLERLTDTKIRVFGKTVSMIGTYENVDNANEAIEKLINGANHKNVYALLEKKKSQKRDYL